LIKCCITVIYNTLITNIELPEDVVFGYVLHWFEELCQVALPVIIDNWACGVTDCLRYVVTRLWRLADCLDHILHAFCITWPENINRSKHWQLYSKVYFNKGFAHKIYTSYNYKMCFLNLNALTLKKFFYTFSLF